LDGDILRIICDSYDGCDIEQLINDDTIRSMYFGLEGSAESLLELVRQHEGAE